MSNFLEGEIVQVAFDMKIGDLVDSQIMQLYPFEFARELYNKFKRKSQLFDDTERKECYISGKV